MLSQRINEVTIQKRKKFYLNKTNFYVKTLGLLDLGHVTQ